MKRTSTNKTSFVAVRLHPDDEKELLGLAKELAKEVGWKTITTSHLLRLMIWYFKVYDDMSNPRRRAFLDRCVKVLKSPLF